MKILEKKPIFLFLLFTVLGFLLYGNVLHGEFQFDDIPQIMHNPKIFHLSDLQSIWQAERYPTRFIPFLTFALNYQWRGLDTFGYHVVNILIHIANAFLVFWLISQLLKLNIKTVQPEHYFHLAFFVALIFLVHPIETQAVSYIYQRLASLAVMFYLLTLNCYIKARMGKKNVYFILAGISAVCAMFSKEVSFTLPVIVLLMEFYFFRENSRLSRKHAVVILLFALIVPLLCALNFEYLIPRTQISESHGYEVLTTGTYFLTQLSVICVYLRLMIWPWGQNIDYDFPASHSLFEPVTFICFLILIFLFIYGVTTYRKNRLISFGIFWFFITLSVESSFIVIRHVIFEHRMYLPSIGIILAAVTFIFSQEKFKNRNMILIVIVCIFSLLTVFRNQVWRTETALWEDVVRKSPNKPRAYVNLGAAYNKNGRLDLALKNYDKVLELQPNSVEALNNRSNIYLTQGRLDLALADVNKAIEFRPQHTQLYITRGNIYSYRKDFDSALADYNYSLKQDPDFVAAYQNRGKLFGILKQYVSAVDDYSTAIKLQPRMAELYNERGLVYKLQGQYILALEDYTQAIRLDSRLVSAYNNRGVVLKELKEYEQAIKDYSKVLTINPQFVAAYNNRGNIFKIIRKYDSAIADYSRAIAIDPTLAEAYFNRGIVLSAKKEYAAALRDMEMVLSLGYEKAASYIKALKEIMEKK